FDTPQAKDLYGQAGRQVFFILVSVYGWVRWSQTRRSGDGGAAVVPRWATARERAGLLLAAALGTVVFAWIFGALGSWGPWADAWIFTGSFLATYGMARGWTEFWLVWIGVDLVGVPLLFQAGYYPSAVLYAVYGGVVAYGFVVWMRAQRTETRQTVTASAGAGSLGS
uniref:nicotinamide riboside transporter PnuC n=1 Tax=Actinotalea sp. TaxID=1872145 RepID=UPI00356AC68D